MSGYEPRPAGERLSEMADTLRTALDDLLEEITNQFDHEAVESALEDAERNLDDVESSIEDVRHAADAVDSQVSITRDSLDSLRSAIGL